jgi:hypothetical protein
MERWGNIEPEIFVKLINFWHDDPRPGLKAYQRDTEKPTQTGDPQNEDEIDFSNFIDEDDKMDTGCLAFLSFKLGDVQIYEEENPEVLAYGRVTRSDKPPIGQPITGEALDASGRKELKSKEKAKQRCRAIAALIVSIRPELRPAQIAECIYMKDFGEKLKIVEQDGSLLHYVEQAKLEDRKKTICEWISDICPNKKTGRRSKDEMLTEIIIEITTKKNPAKS